MKKKGFTLVELLAVIAILAILVIIALPNIIGLFNDAKKESFTNELKQIHKTAQNQWMTDSMFETNMKEYSRCKSGCSNPLKLSGREELEYYIKLDKSGNIVRYYATDGTYQYEYEGNGLKIEDIGNVVAVATITDDSKKVAISSSGPSGGVNAPTYVYMVTTITMSVGKKLDSRITHYDTPQAAMAAQSENKCFRVAIDSENMIKGIDIAFDFNNTIYYLKGSFADSDVENNKSVLRTAFGESHCTAATDSYSCSVNTDLMTEIDYEGLIQVAGFGGRRNCLFESANNAICL